MIRISYLSPVQYNQNCPCVCSAGSGKPTSSSLCASSLTSITCRPDFRHHLLIIPFGLSTIAELKVGYCQWLAYNFAFEMHAVCMFSFGVFI